MRLVLTTGAFAVALSVQSRAQDHEWSLLFDNPLGHDGGDAVATDGSNNILVIGNFTSSLRAGTTSLQSAGSTDIFIAKLSPSGGFLWARQIGGSGQDLPGGIAVDGGDDVFAVGKFSGTADFGGTQVTSQGQSDIFLASYSGRDGSLRWVRTFGSSSPDIGSAITTTPAGDVIIAGSFQQSIDFGGGALVSAGSYDMVLAAFAASNGAHRWSRRFGKESSEQVSGIAVDSGNRLFVSGYFDNQTEVGSGTLTSNGLTDSFLAAFDNRDGRPLWSRKIGGTGYDVSRDVAATPDGDVVIIGYYALFGGPVDFGGGSIEGIGGADAFIARYRGGTGAYVWARGFGGVADDHVRSVAIDSFGNICVAGYFQLESDFGGEPLVSQGQLDIMMAQYSPAGEHLWSHGYGGIIGDQGLGIAVDSNNDIVATGNVGYNVNFGGGWLYAQGYSTPFLVKLAAVAPPPSLTAVPSKTPTWTQIPTSTATPVPPTVTRTFTAPPTPTRTRTATNTIAPASTSTPTWTPTPNPLGVAGRVMYYNEDRPVPSANVALHGPSEQMTETLTSGDYAVMGVSQGPWSVEPAKEGDFGSGVSALDAAYVLQAVTGRRQLNEYQQLACDVTGNGALSSLDAARILQFMVGIVDRLPVAEACGSDWLFVPDAAQVENQQLVAPMIGGGDCQQGAIHLQALTGIAHGQDFKAILFGDCTGNWTMPAPGAARTAARTGAARILAGSLRRSGNGRAWVPIYVRTTGSFSGLEVALRYDAESLTLTGVRSPRHAGGDVVTTYASKRPGSAVVALASGAPLKGGRVLLVEFDAANRGRSVGTVTVIGATVDEQAAAVAGRKGPR
jgi:hypothetical protein